MSWFPIVVISVAVIAVALVKLRDVRYKQKHPTKQWEGEDHEANEQRNREAHKDAAARRGSGNAGGPMG
ncbi:hypothetical protein [Thalassobacillus sp. CUG 92003]|uniref:hypothetical protein n=1 Tax=Thalassobacillus sp. CUG 92003 TaxID=2736641 RepID=UPI0015E762D7|nr:hypothetical protein [Thalassobacillus sp. CUG 92003]